MNSTSPRTRLSLEAGSARQRKLSRVSLARVLRSQGVDVLSVQETVPGATDEAVLAMACETGRWLVTFDRDCGELVFSRQCAPPQAILYLRQEPIPPTHPAEWVLELLAEPETAAGHLVVVGERTVRRRPLPKVQP